MFIRGKFHSLRPLVHVAVVLSVLLTGLALNVASPRPATAAPDPGCESDEAATLATALEMSRSCTAVVRIESMTTETAEFYAQPNGTVTAQVAAGPVRVRDGAGEWVDVDLNLERRPDGSVAARVHPNGLVLSGKAGNGEHDLATLGTGSQQLTVGWRGPLPEPVIDGTKATYVDVKPGVDLIVETTRTGFETFFVVKNREAAAHVRELSLPWRSTVGGSRRLANDGLAFGSVESPRAAAEPGGVSGVPARSVPAATMAPALMWDASVDPRTGEPATRRPFDVSMADRGNGRSDVVLRPDAEFLADEATVYPVTIDPQWDINPVNGHHDTWVENDGDTGWNSTELKLGTYNGGGEVARSYIFWGLGQFHGTTINWATLSLYETWASSCRDAEWRMYLSHYFDHTTHWWNQPPWGAHLASSWQTRGRDDCGSGKGDGWVAIDATEFFRIGANSDYIYWSMALVGHTESNSDTWKRFLSANSSTPPVATVNFSANQAPNTPTAVKPTGDCHPSCTSGSTVRTTTPTLQAVVSDSNPAHTLNVQMEVRNQAKTSVVASTTLNGQASGSTVTWTTPALTNGSTYHYRVRAQDNWGAWGSWSGYYTFTVNTAGPGTPTAVGVTGDCSISCSSPAVLRSARPEFTATVPHPFGDVLSVRFEVLNASSTVIASTTKTSVPAGTAVKWKPSSNLPQQSLRLRVRGTDEYNRTGSWSASYHFTVDTTPPGAPTVTSPLYRHKDTGTWNGGVGVPGSFTVAPNGAADVRVFEYRINGGTSTAVNVAAGASGTFTITPTADLEQLLEVRSIDEAGLTSGWVAYPFLVRPQPADVAYWKFDESSGTVAAPASGGSSNTGTLVGGPGWVASGINAADPGASGNAVSLDGTDDYVQMPRLLATNHASGFSVSAWVKPTSLSGYRTVVSQQGTNVFAFRLYYKPEVNTWCFAIRDADDVSAGTPGVCSSQPAQAGVWTHLVGVYDAAAGKLRLYVNGGPFNNTGTPGTADEADAPPMWAATGAFRVGRSFTGEYLHGLVDEVRAYQRALPEVEARQIYRDCWIGDCPPVGSPTDPVDAFCETTDAPECVGEWTFDEGAGATAGDSSGLGHGLTLHPGATWTTDGYNGTPAVVLDGTGHLQADEPVVLTDQSFAVSAWVRLDNKDDFGSVVSQLGTMVVPFRLEYEHSLDKWCFTRFKTDTASPARSRACGGTPQIGVWTHLAGTYDFATRELRMYVNGSLVGTATFNAADWQGGELLIGRTLYTSTSGAVFEDRFRGTIDLVRVYQGVLSDAQVSTLYAEQLAPPQLRAWYELEEWDAQAYDYSENGNHATVSAQGAAWTVDGHGGSSAIEFDGAAGELTTAGPVLNTSDSFSVSAWVYNTDSSTTTYRTAVAQDGTDTSAFFLQKRQGAWAFVKMPADDSSGPITASAGTVPVNAWVHLVGVYDATAEELRLYVDGTLAATTSCACSGWSATGAFTVGRAKVDGVSTDWWSGRIDGVRAYQGALSQAQVAAIFNGQE